LRDATLVISARLSELGRAIGELRCDVRKAACSGLVLARGRSLELVDALLR